jgi:hypothetical protein
VLWVALVNSLAAVLYPELLQSYAAPAFSASVVIGGLLFGIGAAVNGGCSFATLSKIAQGELHVALTLPAFVLGAVSARAAVLKMPAAETGLYAVEFSNLSVILVVGLAIWGALELLRMGRAILGKGIVSSIRRERYTLSGAAALIGLSSGFLYVFYGRWGYSSKVLDYFASDTATTFVGTPAFYLLMALLAGAMTSAVSNRQWKISFAGDRWHKNLAGGFLMGFGAMLVPGGNAKLILHDLPHLSVHALIAFLAMVGGILLTLLIQKRVSGHIDIVSCTGDECTLIKAEKRASPPAGQ